MTIRKIISETLLLMVVGLCATPHTAIAGITLTAASSCKLASSSGSVIEPLQNDGRRATLLFFIATTCPISNFYAPEISRLALQFAHAGIKTYGVLTDDDLSSSAAALYKAEYLLKCPLLLDPKHSLTTMTGATVTPEAVVLDSECKLIYRGRIDNKFVDFGVSRLAATSFDLREVLLAVSKGQHPGYTETKAIGCFIPPAAN